MAVFQPLTTSDGGYGSGSLRDAIIQANNSPEDDVIELQSGQTYTLSIEGVDEDQALTGDLDIDGIGGQLTIRGLGEGATIDAQGIDRVFHVLDDRFTSDDVDNSGDLVLENLTITGGAVGSLLDGDGGGIFIGNTGSLTANNIEVTGNRTTGAARNGGGIGNDGLLILNNSTISNNIAEDGGGIFNNYAGATITNSVITGNIATEYAYSSDIGSGGGIAQQGPSYLYLSESVVSNNTAGFRGGGIVNKEALNSSTGSMNIVNSTITGNTADDGGGINNQGTLTIEDSTISNNVAARGGGIKADPTTNTDNQLTITNSTITQNQANASGGGIYNDSLGRTTVYYSEITENTALGDGGGFGAQFGSGSIISSLVSNNTAGGNGGGLDKVAQLSNSTVEDNTAGGNGGGLNLTGTNSFINNSTITGNTSPNFGGGIHISSGGAQDYTANIVNTTITENSSSNGGGISVYAGIVTSGSYDLNNYTYVFSDVISFPGNANIVNTTITKNIADSDNDGTGNGGGVWLQPFGFDFIPGEVSLANTIVAGNFDTPENDGGGDIYPNIYGPIRGNNNNLVGDLNGVVEVILEPEKTIGGEEDIRSNNPRLGPLDDYGGDTETISLLADSPAIDAGNNEALAFISDLSDIDQDGDTEEPSPFDQRLNGPEGEGFPRIVNETVDIGAFEFDPNSNNDNDDNELVGDERDNTITGTEDDDLIEGREGNDELIGLEGEDTLDGEEGDDTLRGGPGNDLYIIDSEDDVIEGEKSDGGDDTIQSSVSWSLVADSRNVENLILTSSTFSAGGGNVVDNRITGSDAKNRITGGSGDDLLDGGRREDRLSGNDGNDTLIGGTAGDELTGGQGRDRFQFNGFKDGTDTIVDFNPNADFIVLSESNFGEITEAEFLTIPSLDDLDDDFTRGLIYETREGNLAYIDRNRDVDLTQLAILQNAPELEFDNIQTI